MEFNNLKRKRSSLREILAEHFMECEAALSTGDKKKVRCALVQLKNKKTRLDKIDADLEPIHLSQLNETEFTKEMKDNETYHDQSLNLQDQLEEFLQSTASTAENFSDHKRNLKRKISDDESGYSSYGAPVPNKRIRHESRSVDNDEECSINNNDGSEELQSNGNKSNLTQIIDTEDPYGIKTEDEESSGSIDDSVGVLNSSEQTESDTSSNVNDRNIGRERTVKASVSTDLSHDSENNLTRSTPTNLLNQPGEDLNGFKSELNDSIEFGEVFYVNNLTGQPIAKTEAEEMPIPAMDQNDNSMERSGYEAASTSTNHSHVSYYRTIRSRSHTQGKAISEILNNKDGKDEILLKIFNYLDLRDRISLERVCKKWQKVSIDSWKFINILRIQETFSQVKRFELHHIKEILRRGGKFLKLLDFGFPYINSNKRSQKLPAEASLELISKYCPNLTGLNLAYIWKEEPYLNFLDVKIVRNLKSLCVGNDTFSDKHLPEVLKNAAELEEFFIFGYNYDDNKLLNLSQKCTSLTVSKTRKFSNEMLKSVLASHPNIINLDIGETNVTVKAFTFDFTHQLTALCLYEATKFLQNMENTRNLYFPNLKILNLDSKNGVFVTSPRLKFLIDVCPMLQELHLSNAKKLKSDDFNYIKNLEHLTCLDISSTRIPGKVLIDLAKQIRFKKLYCDSCTGISRRELNEIIDVSPELKYLVPPPHIIGKNLFRYALESIKKRQNNHFLVIAILRSKMKSVRKHLIKLKRLSWKKIKTKHNKTNLYLVYGNGGFCDCNFYDTCNCFLRDNILVSFN